MTQNMSISAKSANICGYTDVPASTERDHDARLPWFFLWVVWDNLHIISGALDDFQLFKFLVFFQTFQISQISWKNWKKIQKFKSWKSSNAPEIMCRLSHTTHRKNQGNRASCALSVEVGTSVVTHVNGRLSANSRFFRNRDSDSYMSLKMQPF